MRLSLFVLTLVLTACGGSGSSSSSASETKKATSNTTLTNTAPAKSVLSLHKYPVSELNNISFQSMNSSSIPAIKTFD